MLMIPTLAAAPVVAQTALGTAPPTVEAEATAPLQGLPGPGAETIPAGSIIAFAPRASGFTGTTMELRGWLAARGWAICDGTRGTPDLRDRMLLGTAEAERVGERLGSRDHDHRLRGETGAPVLRNRHTPIGHAQLKHLPDDQHRHSLDLKSDRVEHLPPSTRVLFIMKLP